MKIRINTHGGPLPVCHGEWIDLCTAEDVYLEKFEFEIISLGVSMQMPEGYYALVVPRSSTYKNFGVICANGMGVIENSYAGDNDVWGFPAIAMKSTFIPKGTRICQFQLFRQSEPVEFEMVESLGNASRGGFGSTGNN